MSDADSYVYFVQPVGGGPIKIGRTVDPHARLGGLMGWSPVDLQLLAYVPSAPIGEIWLHRKLRAHHIRNEWHRPHPDVMAYVNEAIDTGQIAGMPTRRLDWHTHDFKGACRAAGITKEEIGEHLGLSPLSTNNWRTYASSTAFLGLVELASLRGTPIAFSDLDAFRKRDIQ